ncbi:MAG: hypothetical protein MK160_04835 [Rhodobacteraceae bacterium]|nr:hypothetical protein [Paracoccaceae bacterium]
MIEAGLPDAPHRSPKGLCHGFGINATVNGIPLHMLQKWMGHAQLTATAIYADAVGKEEQDIATRMWGREHVSHTDRPWRESVSVLSHGDRAGFVRRLGARARVGQDRSG